jgi:hypothetical protein
MQQNPVIPDSRGTIERPFHPLDYGLTPAHPAFSLKLPIANLYAAWGSPSESGSSCLYCVDGQIPGGDHMEHKQSPLILEVMIIRQSL